MDEKQIQDARTILAELCKSNNVTEKDILSYKRNGNIALVRMVYYTILTKAISFDNYGRYGSVKDGDEVVVKGRLDVNIWENKEGTKVYETRIIVEDIMTADVLYEKQNKSRSAEGSGDSSSWVKTEGATTKQVAPVIEPSLSEYENEELPF